MSVPAESRSTPVTIAMDAMEAYRRELEAALRGHQDRLDTDYDADDEVALALQRRSEKAAEEILDALGRMESGGFGVCTDCGNPISAERLDAIPQASTCGACGAGQNGTRR